MKLARTVHDVDFRLAVKALDDLTPTSEETHDEVARILETLGGRDGDVGDCWGCPIARHLGQTIGLDGHWYVDSDTVTLYENQGLQGLMAWSHPLPDAVVAFVDAFDAGRYPALVTSDPDDTP